MTEPEKTRPLSSRVLGVMNRIERVVKDRENKHHKYLYIGHDDITMALRRAFLDEGIVQKVSMLDAQRLPDGSVGVKIAVTWMSSDDASDQWYVEGYGESPTGGRENRGVSPQQVGIALTYAVKMLQLKNFCLVGDDTPDPEEYNDRPAPTPERSSREEPTGELDACAPSDSEPPPPSRPRSEPPPPPKRDWFQSAITGFEACSSMNRWEQIVAEVRKRIEKGDVDKDQRRELDRAAHAARHRLTSASQNGGVSE